MLKLGWYDYSDAYILMKGNKTVFVQGSDAAAIVADWNNKEVIY